MRVEFYWFKDPPSLPPPFTHSPLLNDFSKENNLLRYADEVKKWKWNIASQIKNKFILSYPDKDLT